MSKKLIKQCHDCRNFVPPDDPSKDPECELAQLADDLKDYPLLRTVKFQRGSPRDCGPNAVWFESKE